MSLTAEQRQQVRQARSERRREQLRTGARENAAWLRALGRQIEAEAAAAEALRLERALAHLDEARP